VEEVKRSLGGCFNNDKHLDVWRSIAVARVVELFRSASVQRAYWWTADSWRFNGGRARLGLTTQFRQGSSWYGIQLDHTQLFSMVQGFTVWASDVSP